ncbi:unnamed protein product [Closterium sp. Naga37s-1]|nr:unnamed protein product [Closterium sp. Naga37s-1]
MRLRVALSSLPIFRIRVPTMADVIRRLSRPLGAQQQAAALAPARAAPSAAPTRTAQSLPFPTGLALPLLARAALPLASRLSFAAAPAAITPAGCFPRCRSAPHARTGFIRDPSFPAECSRRRTRALLSAFRPRGACRAQAHDSAASVPTPESSAAAPAGEGSAERRDGGAAEATDGAGSAQGEPFLVLNFYHFADVEDAHGDVERHRAFLQERDIRGRIYISHQGINAQLSGPASHVMEYAEWVRSDQRFARVPLQLSPSPIGHAFPRLRLRYKPALVQVARGMEQLSADLCAATPLSPAEWRSKIDQMQRGEGEGGGEADGERRQGEDNKGRGEEAVARTKKIMLLDVRNGYEWDVGHFAGAVRPPVDNFRSTEFGLQEEHTAATTEEQQQEEEEAEGQEAYDPLSEADKEETEVLMYCTGGIRCDVYSALLRQQGFKRLYTLEGGVARYMREQGGEHWNGRLFVFDSRLAVPPRDYQVGGKVLRAAEEEGVERVGEVLGEMLGGMMGAVEGEEEESVGCQRCGGRLEEVKHRNCANSDCNALILVYFACFQAFKSACSTNGAAAPCLLPFLACPSGCTLPCPLRPPLPTPLLSPCPYFPHGVCSACAQAMNGACSTECAAAPRLRPFLARPEPYQRLHTYLPSARIPLLALLSPSPCPPLPSSYPLPPIRFCSTCAQAMNGACCTECAAAPRLRPFLARPEPYQRLHTYLPTAPPPRPPGYVSRRALKRRARKARRLAAAEGGEGQGAGEGREEGQEMGRGQEVEVAA